MATEPRAAVDQPQSTGEWKQRILRIYNRVKQDIAGTGVVRQNIHIAPTYIMIVAVHNRVPALSTISERDALLGRWADVALIDSNKDRLRECLHDELGIATTGVFQDYDPRTQVAVTVALLVDPLPGTHDLR